MSPATPDDPLTRRRYYSGPGLSVFGAEEEAEVLAALRSRNLWRYRFGQAPDPDGVAPRQEISRVLAFEREFSDFLGGGTSLGTNSCTSALFAGLLALGIGPGDEVLVPGYCFIASIASIVYCGGTPVLVEVDDTLSMNPEDARKKITPRTRAILCVHMLGSPCDMRALSGLAAEHGLHLVEDVAQSCGGSFDGRPLGTFGRFGAFSLNIFKVITAGDGGVFHSRDRELFETVFAVHDHGALPYREGCVDGALWLGMNLRMHELAGAIAVAQLHKLPRILELCRTQRDRFLERLVLPEGVRARRQNCADGDCGTTLVLQFPSASAARKVAGALGTKTLVESGKHYYGSMPQLARGTRVPNHRAAIPAHHFRRGSLPATDDVLDRSIALSVGVVDDYLGTAVGIDAMSDIDEITSVADTINATLAAAG